MSQRSTLTQWRCIRILIAGCLFGLVACSGDDCGAEADEATSQQAEADREQNCTDMSCFADAVAACQQASLSAGAAGAAVRYQVVEPTEEGCRVQMVYTENPNPDWVGEPLQFVIDEDDASEEGIEEAVTTCMEGDAGDMQCDGPLLARVGADPTAGAAEQPTDWRCGEDPEYDEQPLYPMPEDGKWGYVDADGDWVIEPKWWRVRDFSEGRAVVKATRAERADDIGIANAGDWGVIDQQGEYVLEPIVTSPSVAGSGDDEWGSLAISNFSEGCATTDEDENFPYHVVDRDGQGYNAERLDGDLSEHTISEIGSFSQGLAPVEIRREATEDDDTIGNWVNEVGWVDADANIVIDPQFDDGGKFGEGLAPVDVDDDQNWTYIDEEGEIVFAERNLHEAGVFSAGLAPVNGAFHEDYGRGFIDRDGDLIDPSRIEVNDVPGERFLRSGQFRDGLAPVHIADESGDRHFIYIEPDFTVAFIVDEQLDAEVCNRSMAPEFRHGKVRLLVADDDAEECGNESFHIEFADYDTARYVYLNTDGEVVLEQQ